jgi:hypothetical protein
LIAYLAWKQRETGFVLDGMRGEPFGLLVGQRDLHSIAHVPLRGAEAVLDLDQKSSVRRRPPRRCASSSLAGGNLAATGTKYSDRPQLK